MKRKILIINGHPDPSSSRLCAGICAAYANSAQHAGHDIRRIDVGSLSFPLLRSSEEFVAPVTAADIQWAQRDIEWADHLVIVYPLWLGSLPAYFKGFLEQVFRYGFALGTAGRGFPKKLLKGRSAHVIITMGMPGPFYRLLFGAFGARAFEKSILGLSGISPVRRTIIGTVESRKAVQRALERIKSAAIRGN